MYKIAILTYDNCLLLGIAGFVDLFSLANWEFRRLQPKAKAPFCSCELVSSEGGPVTSFSQVTLQPRRRMSECQEPDLILLPGLMGRPEQLLAQEPLTDWLRQQHRRGALIAGACSGTFLLAEAGILDGRQATTHWQLAERFRQRYPSIDLQVDRLLIDGGDYLCAGGASAHLDLALYLLEKLGSAQLSAACARIMLLEHGRRDQAPFSRFRGSKTHGDESILQIQQWLDGNYRGDVNIKDLAKRSGLSERTFLRRFRKATGTAPLNYLQRMRIEAAKQLLAEKKHGFEVITRFVGYEDVSSFRRLFKEIVGLSPAGYRQRFGKG